MSQDIFTAIDPAVTSGNQLATLLNGFKDAVVSGFSGTSRPPNLQAGGYWLDTTNEGSPNFYWDLKIYTGTVDIQLFRINLASSTAGISGADNVFTLSRISADAAGPLFKLLKERVATNGQTLDGDTLGELQFLGTDDLGNNVVIGKIKSVSSDNTTAAANGGYLVFEATADGTTALVEMMRLVDNKLGIGTTSPQETLHVLGTGAKIEKESDDADGALVKIKKKRISGLGEVLNGDDLGIAQFMSTDDAGDEFVGAEIHAYAAEDHTPTNRGTSLSFTATDAGASSPSEKMRLEGDNILMSASANIEAVKLTSQSVATAATISDLNVLNAIVQFTGSTTTELRSILPSSRSTNIKFHNQSSAVVTFKHELAGETAVNRLELPGGVDIELQPDNAIELFYSSLDNRWKVLGGTYASGELGAHLADTVGAHAASAISNTPSGGVSATDVQSAINELDGDLTAHLNDTTDAHAASAITNTPAGTIAATDVQGAVNELDGDIQGHITDTTDAHAASAITNTPSGNLAATDVQAALNELQSDIDGRVASASPVVTDPILMDHETTPANPPAGKIKIYPKSDNLLYKLDSSGNEVAFSSGSSPQAPQITRYTTGSGTYNVPVGALYIRVQLLGGGGGGGGSGTVGSGGAGTNGGVTDWSGSGPTVIARGAGGSFGIVYAGARVATLGGSGVLFQPTLADLLFAAPGGAGGIPNSWIANVTNQGGFGGSSFLYGGISAAGYKPPLSPEGNGYDAPANSGGGGSGAGLGASGTAVYAGMGGAGGGYVEILIPSSKLQASYTYTVGAGGSGGPTSGGWYAGGAGGSGIIIVTAYFQ